METSLFLTLPNNRRIRIPIQMSNDLILLCYFPDKWLLLDRALLPINNDTIHLLNCYLVTQ